jgi:FkbM family methyltransferase
MEKNMELNNQEFLVCNGIKIGYDPKVISENMAKHIKAGTYEKEESSLISNIIQDGERILEIGAGLGYVSALAMKTGKVKELISFEANPQLIPLIEKTWQLNEVHGRCFNNVITNTSSKHNIDFFLREDFWASSLSAEPYGYTEIVKVETTNFQEILNEFKPTMIICDIEGGEGQLFEGAQLKGINKVFMEVHQDVLGRWGMKVLFDRFSHQGFHYDAWHSMRNVVLFSHHGRH